MRRSDSKDKGSLVLAYLVIQGVIACGGVPSCAAQGTADAVALPRIPDGKGRSRGLSPLLAFEDDSMYWAESNCCGLVAAYVVLHDFGKDVALETLAKNVPVAADGTSMLELKQVFARAGLEAAALRLNSEQLRTILVDNPELDVIALVRPMHWAAVRALDDSAFEVFVYPSARRVPSEQMKKELVGPVLVVGSRPRVRRFLSAPLRIPARMIEYLRLLLALQVGLFLLLLLRATLLRSSAGQRGVPK